MSKSINEENKELLSAALACAITKRSDHDSVGASASVLHTRSGRSYTAGVIETDTNLLTIFPEQTVLLHALLRRDIPIESVTSVAPSTATLPLVLKILADAAARIDRGFSYTLAKPDGTIVFETGDVRHSLPGYTSPLSKLEEFCSESYKDDIITASNSLKEAALSGMQRHIRTKDSGSRYGAAVRAKDGTVFIGASLGSPDKRLGLHAEMAALALLLSSGRKQFTEIAIVSEKFPVTPCLFCGCCRQFISDIARKTGSAPKLTGYALNTDESMESSLSELYPNPWSSNTL